MNRVELLRSLAKIKLLVLDFDGVLTDGLVYFGEDGYEMVCCDRRDGLGINLLQEVGVRIFVVSREKNKIVTMRSKKMGVSCLQSIEDKASVLKDLSKQLDISFPSICFMGDDVNDAEAMKLIGVSVAVADANKVVRDIADHVTINGGGHGAVREICDLIISSKKQYR